MEPIIQNNTIDDILSVEKINDKYFIDIDEISKILLIKTDENDHNSGTFMEKIFHIDEKELSKDDYITIDKKTYFNKEIYEKTFPIKIDINYFDMQINISSNEILPITTKIQSERRRQYISPIMEKDSFKNYQFDERFISSPVIDLTYSKSYAIVDFNGKREQRWNNDHYQMNIGMLVGGFDTYTSVFGEKMHDNHSPRARFNIGRTFLDEKKNIINLVTLDAGDVSGFAKSIINNGASGRGIYASSFKDMILSADKTIDINGPLSEGWDVELYLNEQLIGFRQHSINGRYEFSAIPVSYGLNKFKLIFYGPYGEIRTEEKQYYSGTSPVKKGEFGYTFNAYQKDRYIVETNEPYISPSNKFTTELNTYYGLNDYFTFIGGITQAPDINDLEYINFANAGIQMILSGASLQYNVIQNIDEKETGHHFEAQGNVYIGDIFARYDIYGDTETPVSYYNGRYLKNLFEIRLTGLTPKINIPYYVSYLENNDKNNEKSQEAHFRLSKNFMYYYNATIENTWYKDTNAETDDITFWLQAQKGNLGMHAKATYRIEPETYIQALGAQIDYRWNKNTYVQANWDHDFRSKHSKLSDLDTLSISAGRIFPIGGLTLSLSADTDKNITTFLTYNIGLGKIPNETRVFENANGAISKRSSIYVVAKDDKGEPIEGINIAVTGLQEPVTTNDKGEAILTDIEPYQKTILTVDMQDIDDISLTPDFESKKLVLHPGTVLPIELNLYHTGGIEGQVTGLEDIYKYKVSIVDKNGKTVASKSLDQEGLFIFDEIRFGDYKIVISNGKVLKEQDIKIESQFTSLIEPIEI